MHLIINKTALKSWLFNVPYFSMVLVALLLPSDGNHGLFSPKSLTFLGSFYFLFLYFIIKGKSRLSQFKLIGFTFSMISFFLLWFFLGVTQDIYAFDGAKDQFKLFIITLSFTVMTLFSVNEGLLCPRKVIKTVIYANITYSTLKLLLVLLHLVKVVNMWALLERFGVRFMSMEVAGGFARFQTSVDIITPFLIFFVLQSERLGLNFSRKFKYYFYLVSSISILFSFSRFLMGVGFMSCVLYWLTLNIPKLARAFSLFTVVAFFAMMFIGFENVAVIIERRFFSNDNYYSDLTRKQQIEALLGEFMNSPYIGNGIGGYVKGMIRDGAFVHSYEVQWVAFLMQFGLIGISILLIPIGYIGSRLILTKFSRIRWGFFGLFLIWLFSGFTNPFMISLQSGVIYTLFILAAVILDEKEEDSFSEILS